VSPIHKLQSSKAQVLFNPYLYSRLVFCQDSFYFHIVVENNQNLGGQCGLLVAFEATYEG
jgi:hypothetical protein